MNYFNSLITYIQTHFIKKKIYSSDDECFFYTFFIVNNIHRKNWSRSTSKA